MRIKRLYIGDFGIFRNQILENIGSGMVVIGGLNRAGKSTFMNILKYLGYGFPKSKKIPSYNGQGYEIEADLVLDNQAVYNLKIEGFGEPIITKISGQDSGFTSARSIYEIDEFTYHQLFTINLQQLDRIPREMSRQNIEKLQSILLGAGFAELIRLPVLENEMKKEADKIGGKRGNPAVKLFKPYFNQIQEGIKLKKKALEQVDLYQSKKKELINIENEIKRKQKEIERLQQLEIQLDAVKGNFDVYREKMRLEFKMNLYPDRDEIERFPVNILEKVKTLKLDYHDLEQQCVKQAVHLKESIGRDANLENVKIKLLQLSNHIERWYGEVSGLREQIRQYYKLDEECEKKKADLIVRVQGLNKNWGEEDLSYISSLPLDKIEEGKFLETLENYKALMEERKNLQQSIDRMTVEEKLLLDRLKNIKTTNPLLLFKKYLYGVLVLILTGTFFVFFNWEFGLLLAAAGVIGTGLYSFIKISSANAQNIQKQEIEKRIEMIRAQIDSATAQSKIMGKDWWVLDSAVSQYKTVLGLKSDISSPNVLKEYYNGVRNIREKIFELESMKKQVDELGERLKNRLKDLAALLGELEGREFWEAELNGEPLILQSEYIFATLNKWYKCYNQALTLEKIEQEKKSVKVKIDNLISIWKKDEKNYKAFEDKLDAFAAAGEKAAEYLDMKRQWEILQGQLIHSLNIEKIQNAILMDSVINSKDACTVDNGIIKPLNESYTEGCGENIIKQFEKLCSKYTSVEEVEREWQKNKEKLEEERKQLESLKEQYLRLQDELDSLATIENLEKAQRQIDRGRSELRPLAYQYAVYNIAAFLIRKARENILGEVKDIVLGRAGKILERITNGAYAEILPPDNWMEPDFKAVMGEGDIQETVDILSQGTREQLYLSVRISRILDIKPALPVILDDCMANFDCRHIKESIKIFGELSKTHQIFMLTCHPELVEAAANFVPDAQYWLLDRGRFKFSNSDELITHLLA